MKTPMRMARWRLETERSYVWDTINPILPKYIHGAGEGVTKCETGWAGVNPRTLGFSQAGAAHPDEREDGKTFMDFNIGDEVTCGHGQFSWLAGYFWRFH